MEPKRLAPLSEEFAGVQLGDARLNRRAKIIADIVASLPSAGFPTQVKTQAELEAIYRFVNNGNVSPEALLDAHVQCTLKRAETFERVLVIQDTSEFKFGGEVHREGLGRTKTKTKNEGFFAHPSIVATVEDGKPLGTIGLYVWVREKKTKGRRAQQVSQYAPDRESLRWSESALLTAELLFGKTRPIHVMDREGDCIELFAMLLEHEQDFVIRLSHNRRLSAGREAQEHKLFEALKGAPLFLEREVSATNKPKVKKKGKTEKRIKGTGQPKKRLAHLKIRAESMEIFPGNGSVSHLPDSFRLNFVEASEVDPPEEFEPVLWRLVTTEPIDTEEQVAEVVDIYRKRWLIEEFFKALKTGCNYQKRQLETGRALLVDLAIETAVAWRMLLLRWLSRNEPDAPASRALSQTQLMALSALSKSRKPKLSKNPTLKEAFYAIASIGGHIKNNGPPGWLVLRRGFESLYTAEETIIAVLEQMHGGDPNLDELNSSA